MCHIHKSIFETKYLINKTSFKLQQFLQSRFTKPGKILNNEKEKINDHDVDEMKEKAKIMHKETNV